jgi:hypothetical protein
MSRTVRVIDVFLSSPRDVDAERDFLKRAAHDWNVLRSTATGCHINILTWEDVVAPALSDRPQSVINDGVGDEYDVYLGIMWGRFGSSTGIADSGTVEEFDRALDRYRKGEGLRLAMLFKMAPIPPANLSGEQFDKVRAFKERFSKEGGLYREFEDDEMLRKVVNRFFEDITADHCGPGEGGARSHEEGREPSEDDSSEAVERVAISLPVEADAPSIDGHSDIGFFEIQEELNNTATLQAQFMQMINEANEQSTKEIQDANAEMQRSIDLGITDTAFLRKTMSRIAASMENPANILEEGLGGFKERDEELIELMDKAFDVERDFTGGDATKTAIYGSVEGLLASVLEHKTALDELIGTIRALPRMSAEFNRARKRLLSRQIELRDEMDRLHSRLTAVLDRYKS